MLLAEVTVVATTRQAVQSIAADNDHRKQGERGIA